MRTIIKPIMLGTALSALTAGAAMAQATTDPANTVQAANSGKRPIVAVYTSKPGLADWSDDMLGKDTLKPGKTLKLKLKAKPDGCKVDFNALLDNGDSVTKKGVDLCSPAPAVEF